VAKVFSMYNTVYRDMWKMGKDSFRVHREAREALHRVHESGSGDIAMLRAAVKTTENDLKRITSWCVTSCLDTQLLEERNTDALEALKRVESDIATVSQPPPSQPPSDLRLSDLQATIQVFSIWL
jgi:hypothetical protein